MGHGSINLNKPSVSRDNGSSVQDVLQSSFEIVLSAVICVRDILSYITCRLLCSSEYIVIVCPCRSSGHDFWVRHGRRTAIKGKVRILTDQEPSTLAR